MFGVSEIATKRKKFYHEKRFFRVDFQSSWRFILAVFKPENQLEKNWFHNTINF